MNRENGFSLVELLCVVVIIGIIAALGVPALQRAILSAENGAAFGTMRTIASTQISYFSQNNRFARLTELNPIMGNGLGTTTGDTIVRGRYVFEMSVPPPTDAELKDGYVITATQSSPNETVYKYELTNSGSIQQVLP
ncbi:MAG: type II secretion system protein [Acidobacteriota bacterium]